MKIGYREDEKITVTNTRNGQKVQAILHSRTKTGIIVIIAQVKVTMVKQANGIYVGNMAGMELTYAPLSLQ